jgi:hypothetical protein
MIVAMYLPIVDMMEVVVFPGGRHSANNFDGLGAIMTELVRAGWLDGLDLSAAHQNRPLALVPER